MALFNDTLCTEAIGGTHCLHMSLVPNRMANVATCQLDLAFKEATCSFASS